LTLQGGTQLTVTYIQPGKPQQDAYVERYNRTVRHEWLDQHIIESIEEAQDCATQWLWTYNNARRAIHTDSEYNGPNVQVTCKAFYWDLLVINGV